LSVYSFTDFLLIVKYFLHIIVIYVHLSIGICVSSLKVSAFT